MCEMFNRPVRVFASDSSERRRYGVLVGSQQAKPYGFEALVCEFYSLALFKADFNYCQPIAPLSVGGGVVGMLAYPIAEPDLCGQLSITAERSYDGKLSVKLKPLSNSCPELERWIQIDKVVLLGAPSVDVPVDEVDRLPVGKLRTQQLLCRS